MFTPARTKQEAVRRVCEHLGQSELQCARGSTEPKEVFEIVIEHFRLGLDTGESKPALARGIVEAAGLLWDRSCDSTHTASGGGSTVTLDGLNRVLQSVELLAASARDEQLATAPLADDAQALEGRERLAWHLTRERDGALVRQRKALAKEQGGVLRCEVCDFVFRDCYGELGDDFIECHHRTPLPQLQRDQPTRLTDLALVCSNCHRMLHRGGGVRSIEELRKIVQRVRAAPGRRCQ